jgi:hypothetical protein
VILRLALGAAALGIAALAVVLYPRAPEPPAAETIAVPSGQAVSFVEVIRDARGPSGLTYRFRFLAPGIGGEVPFEAASADMLYLCQTYALPRIAGSVPQPRQIVVSMDDRPVQFGVPAPEATQFFEAYRPEGETCVPELF